MKFTVTKASKSLKIIYLLIIKLEGKKLVKIGITSRRLEDRVCEILKSIYKRYRIFPYCKPKRFTKLANAYKKEQKLLEVFKNKAKRTDLIFNGSTECFEISEELALREYDKVCKASKTRRYSK